MAAGSASRFFFVHLKILFERVQKAHRAISTHPGPTLFRQELNEGLIPIIS